MTQITVDTLNNYLLHVSPYIGARTKYTYCIQPTFNTTITNTSEKNHIIIRNVVVINETLHSNENIKLDMLTVRLIGNREMIPCNTGGPASLSEIGTVFWFINGEKILEVDQYLERSSLSGQQKMLYKLYYGDMLPIKISEYVEC